MPYVSVEKTVVAELTSSQANILLGDSTDDGKAKVIKSISLCSSGTVALPANAQIRLYQAKADGTRFNHIFGATIPTAVGTTIFPLQPDNIICTDADWPRFYIDVSTINQTVPAPGPTAIPANAKLTIVISYSRFSISKVGSSNYGIGDTLKIYPAVANNTVQTLVPSPPANCTTIVKYIGIQYLGAGATNTTTLSLAMGAASFPLYSSLVPAPTTARWLDLLNSTNSLFLNEGQTLTIQTGGSSMFCSASCVIRPNSI